MTASSVTLAMAVSREFADLAPESVCVCEVSDSCGMLDSTDELVDGFPTVLSSVNYRRGGVMYMDRILSLHSTRRRAICCCLLQAAVEE